ncbi:hypothetical protein CFOL_v3_08979 [Cephalotus follicularis]|uniref:Uncharacterized protein n=1 Tax=Cephalotus follicularis TaxID=3775 RepID=A0A1Q3BCB1_CEPFO|nr:hypothetical protein CFOL_v3_08979 [Cephalotus follicularis]
MEKSMDDGDFWLPTEFLTDDDILMDKANNNTKIKSNNEGLGFGGYGFGFGLETDTETSKSLNPYDFTYGYGSSFGLSSDLSSPVESLVGSTETESDEEDFLSGLTRKMDHYTLEDDLRRNDRAFGLDNSKGWGLSGSPQSTLSAIASGCGCRQGSSKGSSNCQSRVSSPPETWDLLYAAAGEVARMKMNEDMYGFNHNKGLLGLPKNNTRKPSVSVPLKNPSSDTGFYPHDKLQAIQYQQLKQQQIMKQQQQQHISAVWGGQTKGSTGSYSQLVQRSGVRNSGVVGRPLGLSPSAWPPLQQPQQQYNNQRNGSGMRAVFLGSNGTKRESVGTGVFLPRRIGTVTECRKKPGCSTVLLPARVVQALNLNLDDPRAQLQPRFNGSFAPDIDVALRPRNNGVLNHQRRNVRPQSGINHEIRLPQEWTY